MADGQAGFCFIRQNHGGQLVQLGYGRSTGFAIDPIEKKPLNHFHPGTPVLSFGTAGCNLGCKFCQNWDISKAKLDEQGLRRNTPDDVVDLAIARGAPSIAYTYNDPVIWAEYVIDIARAARRRGVKNVLVTAGYVTDEARPEPHRSPLRRRMERPERQMTGESRSAAVPRSLACRFERRAFQRERNAPYETVNVNW